jgi:two-component system, cell cycle response regulator
MAQRDEMPARRKDDYDPDSLPLRVLAVDDDDSYLRRLKLVLTRAGFDVSTASDGAAAIERIRADRDIAVLISDLSMPGMDGIETVRRAREASAFPGLYTILLTASDGTEVKLRALDSGLDDFLTKSSSDSEIVAKLRSAARRLQMERRLHVANEELQALALTDELTGISNRRALYREADAILGQHRGLSVVLFDLDRFKYVNDTFGHLMGDRILADVAATLKANTRTGDVIARYGGDEFVLLLPDTPPEEARAITSRITRRIADLRWIVGDRVVTTNVTTGFALAGSGSTIDTLLAECDALLYEAKNAGDDGDELSLNQPSI